MAVRAERQHSVSALHVVLDLSGNATPRARWNVYVNDAVRADELDSSGELISRHERNKVRTTSECHFFI